MIDHDLTTQAAMMGAIEMQPAPATEGDIDLTLVWMAGYHAGTRGRPAHFAPPQLPTE